MNGSTEEPNGTTSSPLPKKAHSHSTSAAISIYRSREATYLDANYATRLEPQAILERLRSL
jgi:hypothetical protein